MRVAIYCRVSTSDQSCELQRSDLLSFAKARGWEVVQVFEEKISGTHTKRPMLKTMLVAASQRKFDAVLVWKLDRFARSLRDLLLMLQTFDEIGITFISLRDNIDLTTSSGRLMMHLLGAFGEFEADLIRERVRAGIRNARAQGKKLGRPCCRNDRQIHALRSSGLSIRQIAASLGTTIGSVQRSLSAPTIK